MTRNVFAAFILVTGILVLLFSLEAAAEPMSLRTSDSSEREDGFEGSVGESTIDKKLNVLYVILFIYEITHNHGLTLNPDLLVIVNNSCRGCYLSHTEFTTNTY